MGLIVFDRLWETMKRKGITKYKLREQYHIEQKTLKRLKENDNVETKTLDKLCEILNCKLDDIATYVKTNEPK